MNQKLSRVWFIGELKDCFFCLASSCMAFRISKKGGAFLTCRACGSRAFLHGAGTRGPEIIFGAMSLAMQDGNQEAAAAIHQLAVSKERENVPHVSQPAT